MTAASCIEIVELMVFVETYQVTLTAHGVLDALPLKVFHILVNTFCAKALHLLEHMAFVYATGPPTSMIAASFTLLNHSVLRTPKIVDQTAFSDDFPAFRKANNPIAHGKRQQANQKTTDNSHGLVATVHYKPAVVREFVIQEQTCIQSNATEQLSEIWNNEVSFTAWNQANKQLIIDRLLQIQSMWDGHLGSIAMSKHRIELL